MANRSPKIPEQIKKQLLQQRFYHYGLQYYIAARFSSFAYSLDITGTLFHHAVELILKGKLIEIYDPGTLKKIPFQHNLNKIWGEFKKMIGQNLDQFNDLIEEVNQWENIRYPGQTGHTIIVGRALERDKKFFTFKDRSIQQSVDASPQYTISLKEMDEFLGKIFEALKINPEEFHNLRFGIGKEFLHKS